jgi:hypothetical protein
MSVDSTEEQADLSSGDWSDSPFPNSLIHIWLSSLEAAILASLTIFLIATLEGGEIIPDILAELTVGLGIFIITFASLTYVRHSWD